VKYIREAKNILADKQKLRFRSWPDTHPHACQRETTGSLPSTGSGLGLTGIIQI
jgi:hypothetical protein